MKVRHLAAIYIVMGFACPLIAAIYFDSGWYLLGWLFLSSFSIKES